MLDLDEAYKMLRSSRSELLRANPWTPVDAEEAEQAFDEADREAFEAVWVAIYGSPAEQHRPAVDDPTWVLERYREAKDIIDDLNAYGNSYNLPDDLRETILEWHNAAYLDRCTTLGPDCGCNTPRAIAMPSTRACGDACELDCDGMGGRVVPCDGCPKTAMPSNHGENDA
jgi:hypothetical protein